jgi:dihydrofolate reductase
MLTSLDLYVEGPDGKFGWATTNPELHRHFNAQAAPRTTHLHGRRMWGTMSAFWPTAKSDPTGMPESREFARYWNTGEHFVFSRSLESVAHGARLAREDALEVVRRLKSGEGSELEVSGPNLAATFIKAGLVEEIGVYINPIAVGGG